MPRDVDVTNGDNEDGGQPTLVSSTRLIDRLRACLSIESQLSVKFRILPPCINPI